MLAGWEARRISFLHSRPTAWLHLSRSARNATSYRPRGRHGPSVCAAVLVQPGGYVGMPLAETLLAFDEIGTSRRRNREVRLTHRWRGVDSNFLFRNSHHAAQDRPF